MKDLYTFDTGIKDALHTYEIVRRAYAAFFNEFKVPYLVAEASSGDIGGDLSHEYHIPSAKGEDNLIICNSCGYVANEELAKSETNSRIRLESGSTEVSCKTWVGITKDRTTLIVATFPSYVAARASDGEQWRSADLSPHKIKSLIPDLDTRVEDPWNQFEQTPEHQRKILRVYDKRLQTTRKASKADNFYKDDVVKFLSRSLPAKDDNSLESLEEDLIKIGTGDACAMCETGTLKIQSSVELGHTFHLGTRYSEPLGATIAADPSQSKPDGTVVSATQAISNASQIPIQMGCHGIGVSRLIAAMADALVDSKGLNWPSVMAPFQAIIVPTKNQEAEAAGVYDLLSSGQYNSADGNESIDTILDDRDKDFGWKLRDADMIGYPVIVVVGRDWKTERKLEVQCRRLGVKESVHAEGLKIFVEKLLEQL